MDALEDIKRELKTGKLVIGTNETLNALRAGTLKRVLVSSNCPAAVKADLAHLGKDTPIEVLSVPNHELGVICKKQYAISVLGESA